MLRTFASEPVTREFSACPPSVARPLADAAERGAPLAPALQEAVGQLGFEHFMYAVAASPRPSYDTRAYVWTSMPAGWVRLYDERAYIETDPRLTAVWESALPIVWDRNAFPDTPRNREFFDSAAEFGLQSGVAFALRNRFDAPGIFAVNSSVPSNDFDRQASLTNMLGDIMALGVWVHDLFLRTAVEQCMPPPTEGRPLSARERECLHLAARGMNSRQIGAKLQIGERTVHSHFASLLAKLGATNRHEAIAKAFAAGIIAT